MRQQQSFRASVDSRFRRLLRWTNPRTHTHTRSDADRRVPHRNAAALVARYPAKNVAGIQAAVVHFDDAVYFVPHFAARRPVARRILRQTYVEPDLHALVESVMQRRPGSMVHAGTFFGDMLPSFSRKTPGTVYAFEPVLEHYLLARAAVEVNGLANVRLLHAGLSTEPGIGSIRTQRGERHIGGAAALIRGPVKAAHRAQDVAILSIDQLKIAGLSIVQLDVEGWELPVLQGGRETLRSQEPVIVIEDNRSNCVAFLAELGYAEVGRLGRDHLYMTPTWATAFADVVKRLGRAVPA